jgi:hypothetical protein
VSFCGCLSLSLSLSLFLSLSFSLSLMKLPYVDAASGRGRCSIPDWVLLTPPPCWVDGDPASCWALLRYWVTDRCGLVASLLPPSTRYFLWNFSWKYTESIDQFGKNWLLNNTKFYISWTKIWPLI